MNASETHEVVVVGARPAGAATAMLLARAGRDVLVVDRAERGADTVSTHALMRPAVQLLQRWGLLQEVIDAGTPPVRDITFHYGDEQVVVPCTPKGGIDALYAPRRTVLDPIVSDAARGSGAEVRHGVRVVGLERSATGRVVGIELVDERGRSRSVAADLVIGADGRNSTVARLVGAAVSRRGRSAAAYLYAHVHGNTAAGYHWHYAPGLTAGVIPTNDGAACVFLGLPPERFEREVRPEPHGAFVRLLDRVAPSAADAVRGMAVPRLRLFTGATAHLRTSHGPGWALVGDAGYFKDPATAHGITDALRDAALLADAADVELDGGDGALAASQVERDRLSDGMFRITDEIASFEWGLDRVRDLHVALSAELAAESKWVEDRSRPGRRNVPDCCSGAVPL
jgi:2-polyprenyl-6-methoxyphenol hydroxylase-like FAD-dependent oxidoreductase